jgi:hypothetical protein
MQQPLVFVGNNVPQTTVPHSQMMYNPQSEQMYPQQYQQPPMVRSGRSLWMRSHREAVATCEFFFVCRA